MTSDDFRLLGTEVLDLSPHGMLIRGEDSADIGEEVILSFRAPGGDEWFDAVARVARILHGDRDEDDGYQLGLEFTEISLETRFRLRLYLRDIPPPVPQRTLRPGLRTTEPTQSGPSSEPRASERPTVKPGRQLPTPYVV